MSIADLARKAIALEINIWRSLYRWITRRRPGLEDGGEAFGYASAVTPILWAFIILSAIEIPVFHLLVPWPTVRLIGLIIGAYGLVWMIGLLASMQVNRHIVGPTGVKVRSGLSLDFGIPRQAIAEVRTRTRSLPSGKTIQYDEKDPGIAHITMSSQTNVDIVLREPTVLAIPKSDGRPLTEVRIFADDPAAMVKYLRQWVSGDVQRQQ
jgi:hypothetical protein